MELLSQKHRVCQENSGKSSRVGQPTDLHRPENPGAIVIEKKVLTKK
jgi:hypothetical protein